MPIVTAHIDEEGAVTITVEGDPEQDNLANTTIEFMAETAKQTVLTLWMAVNAVEPDDE